MKNVLISLLVLLFFGCSTSEKMTEKNLTPIEKLKEGNAHFASGHPLHPDETLKRMRELKKGQNPFVVVVSCSDSRVPPELIFDQGLGDIFSVRTAGNVIGDYELGSIEYAIEHLGCKLVVVMGHEDCGAIHAYVENPDHYEHFDHIRSIVNYISDEEEEKAISAKNKKRVDMAVDANIMHGVHLLTKSMPILKPLVDAHKVQVIGALYDLDDGKVNFFEQK